MREATDPAAAAVLRLRYVVSLGWPQKLRGRNLRASLPGGSSHYGKILTALRLHTAPRPCGKQGHSSPSAAGDGCSISCRAAVAMRRGDAMARTLRPDPTTETTSA